jgi:hypothetical protein
MRARGNELLEPRFRLRRGIGPRDADHGEAARAGFIDERGLELCRIAQKSRLL